MRSGMSVRGLCVAMLLASLAVSTRARAEDAFTVVILPDTQKYSESYPEIYTVQTQWVRDHAASENIVFVSHVGDIVENGAFGEDENEAEWQAADAAMSLLDGHVPWGIVIGNHDFDNWWQPLEGSQKFLDYFGPDRFTDKPYWGGAAPDGLSSYQYFYGSGRRFLVLHLLIDVPPATLAWAQSVLDAHPNLPTMITTHIYMKANGRTLFSYMDFYDPEWVGNSGQEIFELLVSPNPQVFFVNCGHIAVERFQISQNEAGQDVFEALQDYQNRDFGGSGWMRLLEFRPNDGVIQARTYSPWLDEFETDETSNFTIDVDFFDRLGPVVADLDQDNDVDLADAGALLACIGGPGAVLIGECALSDLDFDADVDLADAYRLQQLYTSELPIP